MPTLFASSGASTPVSAALTGSVPQPAVASALALSGTPLAGTLPPMAMPSFQPQGEIAAPSAEEQPEEATTDSDPQQLLDLLLAAPVAQTAEDATALSTRNVVSLAARGGSDISALNSQAESAELLRNSLLAAGSASTGQAPPETAALPAELPVMPFTAAMRGYAAAPSFGMQPSVVQASVLHTSAVQSFAVQSFAVQPSAMQTSVVQPSAVQTSAVQTAGPAVEQAEIALHNVPKKLVTPADALLASQSVQQMLRADSEPSVAESTLLHSAPPRVNALLKGEATDWKLPTITLPTAPEQQAEALQKALAERLEMQIDRRVQKATIRLDPPHLGKMDISIHYESGKLQVQIQAAQPEVTRLLQQVSHEMRASLSEQNNVQVNVQVSTQSGDSRQQQRHRDRPETTIANNNEEVTPQQRGTDGTILTMV